MQKSSRYPIFNKNVSHVPQKAGNVTLIEQKDAYGCGFACLAMVMGVTYEEVRKDWQDSEYEEGVDFNALVDYLGDHGYSIIMKSVEARTHKDFARTHMLQPFAPIHILRTLPKFDSIGHAVVMDDEGKLYCPDNQTEEEVRNSYSITHIIGIYR